MEATAIPGLIAALQQRTEAVAAESAALKSKATRDAAEKARTGVALAAAEVRRRFCLFTVTFHTNPTHI